MRTVIELQSVNKTFSQTVKQYFNITKKEKHHALKDISLKIDKGELLGIVGSNGAGKSTLLGIVAGVYQPDAGKVKISGKVVSIIGLLRVFHDRLTLRQNIRLACALFGMQQKEIVSKENAIISFADLNAYADTQIFQFSSGMIARAIFSVAVHSDPVILLLDEVTANLDKTFTELVSKTIRELQKQGITTVVVSHAQTVIQDCDRAILLKDGQILLDASADQVVKEYFK